MESTYERSWENRRESVRSVAEESRSSYYGVPVIHEPHWKWEIYLYFFLGGIAGGSYVIAAIVDWLGGPGARKIARVGHYLSLATILPSPILLILDLGRPERFHHMLRVVKLRSPMSVGTWGLTVFGAFCTLSALIQAARDGFFDGVPSLRRLLLALPARLLGALGTGPAFFVAGYTGVLLAATAVPLWAKNALLMGPLFIASALSTATSAITLILALARGTNHRTLERLERLDIVALFAELALILSARVNAGPVIARPVTTGRLGAIFRFGVLGAGLVAPLCLLVQGIAMRARPSRFRVVLSSLLVLTGGFLLRYLMVMGGRASARDPHSTFHFTRRSNKDEQRGQHGLL